MLRQGCALRGYLAEEALFLIVFEAGGANGGLTALNVFDSVTMRRWFICSVVPAAVLAAGVTLGNEGEAPLSAGMGGRWSWEMAGRYNHAFTDIRKHSPAPQIDTWGADVTGLYRVRGNHFVTCRFSYAYGAEDGFKLHQLALAPGYRYCRELDERWSVFAGAYVGIGVSMLDYPGMPHRSYALSRKDDMANVVLGAELGARYAIGPNMWVMGAVGLNAGTAPFHSAAFEDATEEQVNLSLRLGIGREF